MDFVSPAGLCVAPPCSCGGGLDCGASIAAPLAVCRGVNNGGQWETVVAAFISNIPAMEKKKQRVTNIIGTGSPAALAACSKVGTSRTHVLLLA